MFLQDLMDKYPVELKSYQGSSLGTSSTQIILGKRAKGMTIHNPHASYVLSYSFDDSLWFEIFPLGTKDVRQDFDRLYLKGSSSSSKYQVETAELL